MSNTIEFNTLYNTKYWNFNAHKIYSISGDDLQLEAAPGKKIQFIGDIADISGSGNLNFAVDTDASFTFGRNCISSIHSDSAVFSHIDKVNQNYFAIKQEQSGETTINGKQDSSETPIKITINNAQRAYWNPDGDFWLKTNEGVFKSIVAGNIFSSGNIDISGKLIAADLTASSQVKSLYYNTTTGEITYDNSGTDVKLNIYSDASFGYLDISDNLTVSGETTTKNLFVKNDISVNNNVIIAGELRGPSTFIIDPTTIGDNTGLVVIKGGLQIDGSSTIINSSTLDISDHTILLSSSATHSLQTDGAGIEISGNKTFTYLYSNDVWNSNIGLNVDGDTSLNKNLDICQNLIVNGETTLSSLIVSDLTNNRLVLAGTSGAIQDSQFLTFDGSNLVIDTSKSIQIPVGTTAERPTPSAKGQMRYNITDSTFEGYDGTAWGSLGGVKDTDGDTYISAETSAGADNDQLVFYTVNKARGMIDSSSNFLFGDTQTEFTVDGCGNVDICGKLQVNHITSISGNDLTIEASGNNKIVFLENDISYNLANFVTATTTTPSEIFYCAKSADSTIADGNTVDITNLNNSNSFRISSGGNNIFDQTTGIFTCQVAGIYQITCKLQIKESAFVLRIGGLYRANSSAGWSTFTKAYDVLPSATGSDRDSESVSVYKQLSVGNQIKFQAYHASQGGNSADMRGHNTEDLTIVMGHKMETTESIPANITTTTSPSELFYCAKSSNQNMNFTEDNWGAYNDITGLDNNNSFRISSGGNNIFDQSTGIFTCQVAGVYFISCKIQLAGWHEEINLSAYFRSSSSDSWPVDNAYFAEHTSYEYGSGGSDDTPTYKRTETLSCYKQLAVGNQIKFATRIFASHGGTKTLYGSSDQDRTVIYGHKMETAVTVTNDILQAYNDASFDYVDISAKLQVNNIISLPDQDTSSVFGKAVVGTLGSYGVFGNYTAQATSTLWCIRQANSGETHIQGNGVEGLRFFNSHASTSNELWIIGGQGAGNGGAGDDGAFLARTQSHNIYARKMYHTVSNTNNSDDRIKHNEVDISGLEIIRQLKPQKYQKTKLKYPADYRGDISGEWNWETGLIAQDILKINDISYCATVNNYLDMYGLTYNDIFVYGLQATKELDIQLQEEKAKTAALQTQLSNLLTRVQALENNSL